MDKRKANQHIPQIIADLSEGRYSLKRVPEGERGPSRLGRIKKLLKKLKKSKGELLGDRLILFFELGKELGDDQIKEGDKNDRLCARRVYKSFEKSYPWIPIGKDWKLRYFSRISVKDAEEIARNWISTELNPVEGKNMWPNQSSLIEAQQSDQLVLQITLQEVINMIDITAVGIFERNPKSRDGRSCGNGTYDLSRKYGSTRRHVSATVWGSGAHDGNRGALG